MCRPQPCRNTAGFGICVSPCKACIVRWCAGERRFLRFLICTPSMAGTSGWRVLVSRLQSCGLLTECQRQVASCVDRFLPHSEVSTLESITGVCLVKVRSFSFAFGHNCAQGGLDFSRTPWIPDLVSGSPRVSSSLTVPFELRISACCDKYRKRQMRQASSVSA